MDALAQITPLHVLTERIDVPVALVVNDSEGDGVKVAGKDAQFVFTMFDLSSTTNLD